MNTKEVMTMKTGNRSPDQCCYRAHKFELLSLWGLPQAFPDLAAMPGKPTQTTWFHQVISWTKAERTWETLTLEAERVVWSSLCSLHKNTHNSISHFVSIKYQFFFHQWMSNNKTRQFFFLFKTKSLNPTTRPETAVTSDLWPWPGSEIWAETTVAQVVHRQEQGSAFLHIRVTTTLD